MVELKQEELLANFRLVYLAKDLIARDYKTNKIDEGEVSDHYGNTMERNIKFTCSLQKKSLKVDVITTLVTSFYDHDDSFYSFVSKDKWNVTFNKGQVVIKSRRDGKEYSGRNDGVNEATIYIDTNKNKVSGKLITYDIKYRGHGNYVKVNKESRSMDEVECFKYIN